MRSEEPAGSTLRHLASAAQGAHFTLLMQTAFTFGLVLLLCVPAMFLLAAKWEWARRILSLVTLGALALGAAVGVAGFWQGQTAAVELSRISPLPFALGLDRLSAFFLLLICGVSVPVVLFSTSYLERHYAGTKRAFVWAFLSLFVLSMIVVVTATTAFAFLFGWEMMTLLSAGLILADGDAGQRRHNVFVYLLMMHAGTAAVLAAFLMFVPQAPGLDFAAIRGVAATMPPGLRAAIFLLAFAGFGTKAGIVPLHLWLPKAHPIAPSPVSALMSGVMLKTAVYALVRFAFDFLGAGPSWWGYLVLAAGALSGVLGVLYAIGEHDLKRLLAYHSVENIGIIYLGLGAALVFASQGASGWMALALVAALLHTINHALFKSALFLGAGAISEGAHTLDIEELGGLMKRMPVTGAAFLVACCSIVGLPLFNGFVSEWLTFRSFLAGGTLADVPAAIVLPLMAGALALIGGLAAACFAKVLGVAFLGRPRSDEAEHAKEVPPSMQAAPVLLGAACIAIGVLPGIVLRPLGAAVQQIAHGAVLPEEAFSLARVLPWVAAAVVAVALAARIYRGVERVTSTWACGLPALDRRMQYTSTSFSKPLRKVFARVYRPERHVEVVTDYSGYFPRAITYKSVRTTSFERSLYRPGVDAVVAAAHRLRRLQTGNVQVYLLYIFIALVTLLVFMRFL